MSVGDVKATVREGIRRIDEARRTIAATDVEVGEASGLTRQTVHDSRHPEVERALTCIREARREIDMTARRLDAGAEAAHDYLTALG